MKDNYITPCYEQLVGAAYSLLQAEKFEFGHNTVYEPGGLADVVCGSIGARIPQHPHWDTWVSGFYFNCALHRIAWATDRLLAIFSTLPQTSGRSLLRNRLADIEEIKQLAAVRISDLRSIDPGLLLSAVSATLSSLDNQGIPLVPVSGRNFLSVIRWRVNIQKHAIEGLAYLDEFRKDQSKPAGWWGSLTDRERLSWAAYAFNTVSQLYEEIHRLVFEQHVLFLPED